MTHGINRSWLKKWSLRFLSVGATQVICQLLNGIVAFTLVRSLSKEEFAWFSIATSMAAVLSSLNDGGIATAVTSIGGEVWQDKRKFSTLMAAALALLNQTATIAAALVTPLLAWLLWEQQASWWMIFVLAILIVAPQWINTRTVTLSTANRLHSRIRQLQFTELAAAFTRSCLTLVPALFGWINVYMAMGTVAISAFIQSRMVRAQVAEFVSPIPDEKEQIIYRGRIQRTMRHMYPNTVFNCIQSQLAMGLLSVMGTTSQVADLGALNRLGFFLNLIGAPLAYLIGPAFARTQDRKRLIGLFLAVLCGYIIILFLFLLVIHWQEQNVLWLFGPKYKHLGHELFLVALSLSISFVGQVFWTLNYSRGWVRLVWINIPLTLTTQIASVLLLDIGTVSGAAWLMCSTAAASLILGVIVSLEAFHSWDISKLNSASSSHAACNLNRNFK